MGEEGTSVGKIWDATEGGTQDGEVDDGEVDIYMERYLDFLVNQDDTNISFAEFKKLHQSSSNLAVVGKLDDNSRENNVIHSTVRVEVGGVCTEKLSVVPAVLSQVKRRK